MFEESAGCILRIDIICERFEMPQKVENTVSKQLDDVMNSPKCFTCNQISPASRTKRKEDISQTFKF